MLYLLIAKPQGLGSEQRLEALAQGIQARFPESFPLGPRQFHFQAAGGLAEVGIFLQSLLSGPEDQFLLANLELGKYIERNLPGANFRSFEPDLVAMAQLSASASGVKYKG